MLVVVLPSPLLSHWTCGLPWWRAASSGPYHQWTCVRFASFEPCRAGGVVVGVNCLTGRDGRSTGKRDRCGNHIGLSRWACRRACLFMEYDIQFIKIGRWVLLLAARQQSDLRRCTFRFKHQCWSTETPYILYIPLIPSAHSTIRLIRVESC